MYTRIRHTLLILFVLALTAMLPYGGISRAQGASRTFPETGKTVSGRFFDYWNTHGSLAQQGFPISEVMQEASDTDGRVYTVQYFERAVFEMHPELAPPNDVLLSLLGVFLYQKKYPSGAPGQTPNGEANSRLFVETGKRVGGVFLDYWNTRGGLAQQGFPISEEFSEVSDLNGQSYKVQYFERAVFEWHPENPPPYNVLLSQLGTFRYRQKYSDPPTPIPTAATPVGTPVIVCDPSGSRNGSAAPGTVRVGDAIAFRAQGFVPREDYSFWFTSPSDIVVGTTTPVERGVKADGTIGPLRLIIDPNQASYGYGRWAFTIQGTTSGVQAVIYFCLVP